MSANEKEKIFVELRNYHLLTAPAVSVTEISKRLKEEFTELEDKIINMILSFISGKAEFADLSSELATFKNKVNEQTQGKKAEASYRDYFLSKAKQLKEILLVASKSSFKIRPQRYNGTVLRNPSRITTRPND